MTEDSWRISWNISRSLVNLKTSSLVPVKSPVNSMSTKSCLHSPEGIKGI